ncbi:MAG: hypothetical protein COA78_14490 [Blastopirellula sp.]|nr:MAG: hypothetical protein COA78_14490 [Blastopirellula sp.]
MSVAAMIFAYRKSFETGTYNNTIKQPIIYPTSKTVSKKRPPVKSAAAEGVFKKIDLRSYTKKPLKSAQRNK